MCSVLKMCSSKWQEVLKKAGFSPKDVFNEAVRMGVSIRSEEADGKRMTQRRRINGKLIRCITVIFREDGDDPDGDELPF